MIHYFLRVLANKKTGDPQILTTSPKHDLYDVNGVYEFIRNDFPEIKEIKYLILDKKASLADILDAEMLCLSGLLMNNKSKEVFFQYNLPLHKYYSALIKDSAGNVFPYYWLQTSKERDMISYIDFNVTQFYIQKDMLGLDKEPIDIRSIVELDSAKNHLKLGQGIKISKLVLNKGFDQLDIDLFKVSRLSIDWIISERLKEALENANITGISIKPADNIKVAKDD